MKTSLRIAAVLGAASVFLSCELLLPKPKDSVPVVSLTFPAAGSSVTGVVLLSASATDATSIFKVTFYVDGIPLAEDYQAPWQSSWNCDYWPSGEHALFARAYNAAGKTSDSSIITVTRSVGAGVTAGFQDDFNIYPLGAVTPGVTLQSPPWIAGAVPGGSAAVSVEPDPDATRKGKSLRLAHGTATDENDIAQATAMFPDVVKGTIAFDVRVVTPGFFTISFGQASEVAGAPTLTTAALFGAGASSSASAFCYMFTSSASLIDPAYPIASEQWHRVTISFDCSANDGAGTYAVEAGGTLLMPAGSFPAASVEAVNFLSFSTLTLSPGISGGAFLIDNLLAAPNESLVMPASMVAPTGLTAARTAANDGILLGWTDASSNENAFVVRRGTSPDEASAEIIDILFPESYSYTDYGDDTNGDGVVEIPLSSGATYYYWVDSLMTAWTTARAGPVSALFLEGPAAPTGATATKDMRGVALSWADIADDEGGYRVYRQEVVERLPLSRNLDAGISVAGELPPGATSFFDWNVGFSTSYIYTVAAWRIDPASGEAVEAYATGVTVDASPPLRPAGTALSILYGTYGLLFSSESWTLAGDGTETHLYYSGKSGSIAPSESWLRTSTELDSMWSTLLAAHAFRPANAWTGLDPADISGDLKATVSGVDYALPLPSQLAAGSDFDNLTSLIAQLKTGDPALRLPTLTLLESVIGYLDTYAFLSWTYSWTGVLTPLADCHYELEWDTNSSFSTDDLNYGIWITPSTQTSPYLVGYTSGAGTSMKGKTWYYRMRASIGGFTTGWSGVKSVYISSLAYY